MIPSTSVFLTLKICILRRSSRTQRLEMSFILTVSCSFPAEHAKISKIIDRFSSPEDGLSALIPAIICQLQQGCLPAPAVYLLWSRPAMLIFRSAIRREELAQLAKFASGSSARSFWSASGLIAQWSHLSSQDGFEASHDYGWFCTMRKAHFQARQYGAPVLKSPPFSQIDCPVCLGLSGHARLFTGQ